MIYYNDVCAVYNYYCRTFQSDDFVASVCASVENVKQLHKLERSIFIAALTITTKPQFDIVCTRLRGLLAEPWWRIEM